MFQEGGSITGSTAEGLEAHDQTHLVTEVEETNGETAEDDGEVQPREEGTPGCQLRYGCSNSLIGEEHLGLNANGESDTLLMKTSGIIDRGRAC